MARVYSTQIIAKQTETPQVQTLHCIKPSGFTYTAGQYFFLAFEYKGQSFKKPLSFSSAPYEPKLSFPKRISSSEFSQAILQLQPGDNVNLEGPFGTFILPEAPTQIIFIAGGIGITPFRSMLMENAKIKQHNITLLYGNISEAEIIFKKELEQFNPQYQIGGTITADFIKKKVTGYAQKLFYICGSPGMVTVMCSILQNELCVPNTQIRIEKLAGY